MRIYSELIEHHDAPRTLALTYEQRLRHRILLTAEDQSEIHILLPRGSRLTPGLHLRATDGSALKIGLALEDLSRVEAEGLALARACYHLGNRHIPAAITASSVSYQKDHVIDAMMEGLGFRVTHQQAGFDPEPGAYHGHHHS